MAKFTKSLSFKSASIDVENDTITEITKDETKYYKLSTVLKEWDQIKGINITFKTDDELESEDLDADDEE